MLEAVLSDELARAQKQSLGLANHSILRHLTDCVRVHVLNYHIIHCVSLTTFMQKLCCLMIGLSNPPQEPHEPHHHSKSLLGFAKNKFQSSSKADSADRRSDQLTLDKASSPSPSSGESSPNIQERTSGDSLEMHFFPAAGGQVMQPQQINLQMNTQSGHSTADTFTLGYLFEFCSIMASYVPVSTCASLCGRATKPETEF